ncbi:MAG: hypothetical protein M0C28_39030 [Candidatus Moduliflexus flocculans]|nr:hypothetical protein [Candidatus Moduliflexus flocculans]
MPDPRLPAGRRPGRDGRRGAAESPRRHRYREGRHRRRGRPRPGPGHGGQLPPLRGRRPL